MSGTCQKRIFLSVSHLELELCIYTQLAAKKSLCLVRQVAQYLSTAYVAAVPISCCMF